MVGVNLAWRDLLLSLLLTLFAMILLAQPTDPENLLKPPGNLMVFTTWTDVKSHDDVDIWMVGPGITKPIGYDNKDSEICNLVKDDLGHDVDDLGMNFENIFCRTTPDGEYIINVYAFSVDEFPTIVNIQIVSNTNGAMRILFDEKVTLTKNKEEVTVIRFKMKDGVVVPGSVHHTFVSLFDK